MTSTRAVAYIGGASLLLAWLASASGVARQPRRAAPPSQASDSAVLQTIATDVQAQAARLRHRLATAPAPHGPIRNPFAFGTRPVNTPRTARRVAASMVTEDVPAAPIDVPLALLGIAEQATPAGNRRTAMIAAPGDELIMASEGQMVGTRYRVTAVGADAVELADLLTGATRRLALQ